MPPVRALGTRQTDVEAAQFVVLLGDSAEELAAAIAALA